MTDAPLISIAAGLGLAGAAKLAGVQLTRDNFARWGYPESSRIVIGGIEVGVAATAISALKNPEARGVAALGTLCSMVGAAATHKRAGEAAYNYVPVLGLTVAAVAVLAGK